MNHATRFPLTIFVCPVVLVLLTALADAESPPTIDEIVVIEQKNVSQLRAALSRADDRLFSLYNELNDDDELDMICEKETRIGSQIKYRVCKSVHHRNIESDFAEDALMGDAGSFNAVSKEHYDKVRSNISNLMASNPELMRAFYERAVIRKRIAERKAK